MLPFDIHPLGDRALTITFGDHIDPDINHAVMAMRDLLSKASPEGITEYIPTYCSLTVCYDPMKLSYRKLSHLIRKLGKNSVSSAVSFSRIFFIPVCYGGKFGEDMERVCSHTGLSEQQIIDLHTSTDYRIYMLGFLPGFSYLGGLDARLHTPRLPQPRTAIPQGSVGIGGAQTGIYPLTSPGGWNLIGRTPVKPYDAVHETILYKAGDYIRFVPVSEEEYDRIARQIEEGSYICPSEMRNPL